MLMTKECDYGVRIVRALADGEKKTVKTVCERELIPLQYAYKILKKMDKAGLVQSRQGPDGGYSLVKKPRDFSLYDVVCAVDNEFFVFECVKEGSRCPRNTQGLPCAVHQEFIRLQGLLVREMKSKTMAEVLHSPEGRKQPEK